MPLHGNVLQHFFLKSILGYYRMKVNINNKLKYCLET